MKNIFKMKYLGLLVAFIVTLLASSCTERISLDLDNANARLIVEGQITNDTTKQWVILTRSGDALNSGDKVYISNAQVTISDGTSMFYLNENPSLPGHYETADSVYGVPGRTYTLSIKNVDIDNDKVLEEYVASAIMKKENPIDSIKLVRKTMGHNKGWYINMYSLEIGGGRNFYMLKAYKNNKLLTDSTYEIGFSDNLGFEGQYYDGLAVYMLSESKVDEKLVLGDTVTLELSAITEDYYHFLLDFISEYYPKLPIFSGPSSNITTNIEPKGKASGFFAAYSVERKSIILK